MAHAGDIWGVFRVFKMWSVLCRCNSYTGPLFTKRVARCREVSKPPYLGVDFFNRSAIWQAHWQQHCRDALLILERCDHYNIKFRGFESCGKTWIPSQRPVMRNFDVFLDLCLNKRLSKQSWGWWFETPLCLSWRHCNACCNEIRLYI